MNIIATYTRKEALADGQQIDITETAQRFFRYPVFITRGAYAETVETGGNWVSKPDGTEELELPFGQDASGRLWDVINLARFAALRERNAKTWDDRVRHFVVSVFGYKGHRRRKNVLLYSVIGPLDIDDPSPAITIMLPEEV